MFLNVVRFKWGNENTDVGFGRFSHLGFSLKTTNYVFNLEVNFEYK